MTDSLGKGAIEKIIGADGKNVNQLMESIETAFKKSGISTRFDTVEEIIKTDENSAAFIREVLHDEDYHIPDHADSMYAFAKSRAQHSVLTFFVGLVFLEFGNLGDEILEKVVGSNDKMDMISLWMLTALYHDWGYYSEDLRKSELNLNKLTKYFLLTDAYNEPDWLLHINGFTKKHPHVLAYSYDEIRAYDQYARTIHPFNENDMERIDHGILGGVKIFDRLVRGISRDVKAHLETNLNAITKRLVFAKIACLTIAQHNIFKSEDADHDQKYGDELRKLHSDSPFRISTDTPLLMLLSLVDTFECIKRFGKLDKESKYLQHITILKNIKLSISLHSIAIFYSSLMEKIEKKDELLKQVYSKYLESLCKIGTWTAFSAIKEADNTISIRMPL